MRIDVRLPTVPNELRSTRGLIPLVLLLAACGLEQAAAPALTPRVVVHAVLDPSQDEQVILVERTREASAPTRIAPSPGDPIASVGGSPISGARVLLIGPGSDTVVATEDTVGRGDGTGAGVYRVRSVVRASAALEAPAGLLRLVPGSRYRLVVETTIATVRGSTVIPSFSVAASRPSSQFNLDRDTLWLPLRADRVGGAAYVVGHARPGFSSSRRTISALRDRLLVPAALGDSAWTFAAERAAISPGTTQRFIVTAVDANYLRYSVVGADPFGNDVAGNTVEGGVGLFGAVATLVDQSLDLVADRDHAIEGNWTPLGLSAVLPVALRLFESPRFPRVGAGAGLHLSGMARLTSGVVLMAEATLTGSTLTLVLRSSATATAVLRFTGTFDGQALTLQPAGSSIRVQYRPEA